AALAAHAARGVYLAGAVGRHLGRHAQRVNPQVVAVAGEVVVGGALRVNEARLLRPRVGRVGGAGHKAVGVYRLVGRIAAIVVAVEAHLKVQVVAGAPAGVAHGADARAGGDGLALAPEHGAEKLVRVQVPVDGLEVADARHVVHDADVQRARR